MYYLECLKSAKTLWQYSVNILVLPRAEDNISRGSQSHLLPKASPSHLQALLELWELGTNWPILTRPSNCRLLQKTGVWSETRVSSSQSACAKPPVREMESVWMAHLPLSREQGGHSQEVRKWVCSSLGVENTSKRRAVICAWAPAVTGLAHFLFQIPLEKPPPRGEEVAVHWNTGLWVASFHFVAGFQKQLKCLHSQVYFVCYSLQVNVSFSHSLENRQFHNSSHLTLF